MQDLKKQCTDFHILFSRSKLHCVELTFFEGKLGGFFVVKVLKSSYKLTKQFSSELNLLSLSKCNKF